MVSRRLLHACLIFALLTTFITAQKQSSSSERSNNLQVVTLPTNRGDIRVTLPSDIVAGDTVSGTVIAEPKGKNEQERKANLDRLEGYVIGFGDQSSKVSRGEIRLAIPQSITSPQLTLSDERGKQLAKALFALGRLASLAARDSFSFPVLGQSGRPIEIIGPFDGDSSNTSVNVGGTKAKIIAESPRSAVIDIPDTIVGRTNIEVNDNRNSGSGKIRALKIDLTAPKTSLTKGESTELHVQVQGLQGITQPVPIQIQNQTPQTINVTGGNTQNIVINPSQVTSGGTFNWTTNVTGTGTGGFNITGTIPTTPPQTPTSQRSPSATPAPSPQSSPSVPPATATGSPSALPMVTPMSKPEVSPATDEQKLYASFADVDSDCCKKLVNGGVLSFGDDKGNSFTIDHDKLKIVVGGKTSEWQFTQDGKPFYIEWMFCHLKDHQIVSQTTQVLAQRIQGGNTSESGNTTSISLAGPYRDEQTTRPFYGFQFSALKVGTDNKEYGVSFSLDAETCKWSFQLFAEETTAWYSNGPPGSPNQIYGYLTRNSSLTGAASYRQGAWWNNMYRVGGEIQNWNAWLADHPNDADSYQLAQAYAQWSQMVKNALDKMQDSASDADRQLFDQMRDLLDDSKPSPEKMNQIFWKFNDLWMRFRNGVPPK